MPEESNWIPEGMGSNRPIYNEEARKKSQTISALIIIAPFFGALASILLLLKVFDPTGENWIAQLVIVLVCLSLGITLMFWLPRFVPFRMAAAYRKTMQPKCERDWNCDLTGASFVGISPSEKVQDYGGDTAWDIGFLVFQDGGMRYFGDMWSFELLPDQVESVSLSKHKSFLCPQYRVHVTWRHTSDTVPAVLSIECRDAFSVNDAFGMTRRLVDTVESWRKLTVEDSKGYAEKYITRCAKYAEVDNQTIAVQSERSPVMITFDSLPREVFLAADGKHRVGDLIKELRKKYKGDLNKDFDKEVIRTVRRLSMQGLMRLSDEPVYLPLYLSTPTAMEILSVNDIQRMMREKDFIEGQE